MGSRIKTRRDTLTNWNNANPVLADGEIGLATGVSNALILKVGDGVKRWLSLSQYRLTDRLLSIGTVAPAVNSQQTSLHNMNVAPFMSQLYLQCKTASNGYAVGDIVVPAAANASLSFNTTNLFISQGSALPTVAPKAGGAPVAITAANWVWYVAMYF